MRINFNFRKYISIVMILVLILCLEVSFNYMNKVNIKNKELSVKIKQFESEIVNKNILINEYKNKYRKTNQKLKDVSIECANLENTIRELTFSGVKPVNYKIFQKINRGSYEQFYSNLEYVGEWLGTYYAPTKEECGNNKGLTASGKPVTAGHTIAVDKHYWKMGTKFYVEGLGICEAIDTGSAIKGKNRLDYCVFNKDISHLGKFKVKVWMIK